MLYHLMLKGLEKSVEHTEKDFEEGKGMIYEIICNKKYLGEDYIISSGGETEDEVYTDSKGFFVGQYDFKIETDNRNREHLFW